MPLVIGAGLVGIIVGGVIAWVICQSSTSAPTLTAFPTHRPNIHVATKETLDDCHFTANDFPMRMYQVDIAPQTTPALNVHALKPTITFMDVGADVKPVSSPTVYNQSSTATTPLDLNLDLGPANSTTPGPQKPSHVLIRIVDNDASNPLFGDDYTVISIDANRQMFCKYRAYTKSEAVIGVKYMPKPSGQNALFGSYSIGVTVKQPTQPDLPVWLDPEVENNGFF